MDIVAHPRAERRIDALVARDARQSFEGRRHDHGLEVLAVAGDFDVTALELNQMYRLSDIKLPEGVTLVALAGGQDYPVVAINVPRAEEIDVPVETETPAGEVPALAQAEPGKEGEAAAAAGDAAKADAKGGAKAADAKGGKGEGKK